MLNPVQYKPLLNEVLLRMAEPAGFCNQGVWVDIPFTGYMTRQPCSAPKYKINALDQQIVIVVCTLCDSR